MKSPVVDHLAALKKIAWEAHHRPAKLFSAIDISRAVEAIVKNQHGDDLAPHVDWILDRLSPPHRGLIDFELIRILPFLAQERKSAEALAPRLGAILDGKSALGYVTNSSHMLPLLKAAAPHAVLREVIEPRIPHILNHHVATGRADTYSDVVISWYDTPDRVAEGLADGPTARFNAIGPSLIRLLKNPMPEGLCSEGFIQLVNGFNYQAATYPELSPLVSHMSGCIVSADAESKLFILAKLEAHNAVVYMREPQQGRPTVIQIDDKTRYIDFNNKVMGMRAVGALVHTLFSAMAPSVDKKLQFTAQQATKHTQRPMLLRTR